MSDALAQPGLDAMVPGWRFIHILDAEDIGQIARALVDHLANSGQVPTSLDDYRGDGCWWRRNAEERTRAIARQCFAEYADVAATHRWVRRHFPEWEAPHVVVRGTSGWRLWRQSERHWLEDPDEETVAEWDRCPVHRHDLASFVAGYVAGVEHTRDEMWAERQAMACVTELQSTLRRHGFGADGEVWQA